MTNGWESVILGELLEPVSRQEPVLPDCQYDILGAHWYAKGLYTKASKSGSAIAASKVYRIVAGDFIYNRLFAWKGSFALATQANDGCYVSNEFPCFLVNSNRLEPQFLLYFFSRESTWNEVFGLSTGGTPTSRNRLKESTLMQMRISLPPLSEQRRIVNKIDGLAAGIEETLMLHHKIDNEWENLCRSFFSAKSGEQVIRTPMRELVSLRKQDTTVIPSGSYHFAGVYCFGRGVFVGEQKTGLDFAYKTLTRLRAGEFLYPKLMAWEGALGIVPQDCDGLYVSPEYPVFEVNTDRVLPETLDVYFRSPSVWPQMAEISTGTNVRRRRLHPKNFLSYQMPLPSMETQKLLREVRTKVNGLKSLRSQSTAELNALLPSILDKAFKGDL